jgi:predicted RNA binding protein YcfA (HicA-like mRNA interferase family)
LRDTGSDATAPAYSPSCVKIHTISSRETIRLLRADGWQETQTKGSHRQFKHTMKPGVVTVPHPNKDLPLGAARAILKSAGIEKP